MDFFEKYMFLEFFDTEKIIDEDASISVFTVTLEDNTVFSMYVSPHEEYVSLELVKKNRASSIFEIGIAGLSHIKCDKETIYFFRQHEKSNFSYQDVHLVEHFWSIRVKPTVHFRLNL
jgi:hypothetical protein